MADLNSSAYTDFPVYNTIDIKELSDVPKAVVTIIQAYRYLNDQGNFSYRLLLPRGEKILTAKAKKIGLALQSELFLQLKKNKLKVNLKEIRYIHDQNHYGWLLFNPSIEEKYFAKDSSY